MSSRKVMCDPLLGTVAVRDQRLFELSDSTNHVSPAGVKGCAQLVQQLVHGRI